MISTQRTPFVQHKDTKLEELLDDTPNIMPKGLSPDEELDLLKDLQKNAPSEMQIRMNLLGINKFTVGGFMVAFVLLALNTVLGAGWLGDYFGLNEAKQGETYPAAINIEQAKVMETMRKGVIINYKDIENRLKAH